MGNSNNDERQTSLKFLQLLFTMALLATVLSSCGRGGAFSSAYTKEALQAGVWRVQPDRESLRIALEDRLPETEFLWMKSGVTVRQDGVRGKKFFTARAMYQEPDHLRFQGSRVPLGVLFDAVLVGDEAALHFPREGRLFEGTGRELAEKLRDVGGLEPMEFVQALLVLDALRDRLREGGPVTVRQVGDRAIVAARDPETRFQFFWTIRLVDALVEEVLVRTPDGREQVRIHYGEYRQEPFALGLLAPMPYEFNMELIANGASLEAKVEEYRMEKALPAAAWRKPAAREVYPLASLQFEESE